MLLYISFHSILITKLRSFCMYVYLAKNFLMYVQKIIEIKELHIIGLYLNNMD